MSTDILRDEHNELRREARQGRREFAKSTERKFARAMREAMTEYHRMREQGVSREDACRGLEAVIREAWPKALSKFGPMCQACEDTGWRETSCTHAMRCGRRWCSTATPEWDHLYVVACDCANGERFKARLRSAEDEIAAVGRQSRKAKRADFSRVGQ